MGAMMANGRHTSQVNTIDAVCLKPAKASMRVNEDSTPINSVDGSYLNALHQAIDSEGMSRKEAAYTLGVDPAQLSRGAVSVDRIAKLPLTMQQRFLELACVSAGLKATKATAKDEKVRVLRESVNTLLELMEAE